MASLKYKDSTGAWKELVFGSPADRVYIGSGELPAGYTLQIDPSADYNIPDLRNYVQKTEMLSAKVLGEIVQSVTPLNNAGLHLLDGSVISASSYPDFYEYISGLQSSHPQCFASETDWQSSITTYGSCGKFVLSETGVRLPKITNILQGTSDLSQVGSLIEAGLPNITGTIRCYSEYNLNNSSFWTDKSVLNGAFYWNASLEAAEALGTSTNMSTGTYDTIRNVRFDASKSNSIYGKSSTVQPQTVKVLFYICIANVVNNPAGLDLSNLINNYLPKAGGTVSGDVLFNSARICSTNNDTYKEIWIQGDTKNWGNGALLTLVSKDASTNTGSFILSACKGEGEYSSLVGRPNGTLEWNGGYIPSLLDFCDTNGNAGGEGTVLKFDNGLMIQCESVNIGSVSPNTGGNSYAINWKYPFKNNFYNVQYSMITDGGYTNHITQSVYDRSRTRVVLRVYNSSSNATGECWYNVFAIGLWK